MAQSIDILDRLTPEERVEAAEYIAYRRQLADSGLRPVVASSRGSRAKIIKPGSNSLTEFVELLLKPEMLVSQKQEDPLLAAKLRGVKAMQQMVEYEGEPWSSNAVANYLDISVGAVSKQRRNQKLLGLHMGSKGYLFPSWQFESGKVIPGLSEVIATLSQNLVPDWDKLRFFLSCDYRLKGKTPIAALRSGSIESVEGAAKLYGVQSAS